MDNRGVVDGRGALRRLGVELAAVPAEGRVLQVTPPPAEREPEPAPGSSSLAGGSPSSLERPPAHVPLTIHGRITDSHGLPVAGVTVRAFSVRMREERRLGRDVTSGPDGRYVITALEGEDLQPNVRVAVVDATGAQLASSALRQGSGETGPIDISLADRFAGRSRFDQYLAAVKPALDAVPLAEAEPSDVAFLAEATGIPAPHLDAMVESSTRAVTGAAGSADRGVFPADVWFGWKSAGLDLQTLWQVPTGALVGALARAGESRAIPGRTADDLASIRERIDAVKLDLVLEAPAPGTSARLDELLSTMPIPLDRADQRAVAGAASELRADDPELRERVAAMPGFDGDAAGVARALRLGVLTGGHLPIVRALQSVLADEREGTLEPLVAFGTDQLIDLAFTHGSPDPAVSPVDYAEGIAVAVERLYPTAALTAHLERGDRLARQPLLADVPGFLRANPGFDLATTNVSALDDAELAGIFDRDRLRDGLLALQRFRTVGATLDESAALLDNGISGPHELLAAGPGQLSAALGTDIGDARIAGIHRGAADLHNVTFGTFAAAFSAFGGPRIPVDLPFGGDPVGPDIEGGFPPPPPPRVAGPEDPDELVKRLLSGRDSVDIASKVALVPKPHEEPRIVPEGPVTTPGFEEAERHPALAAMLQRLFGPQDTCACEHCGSVLGPSAYFVDLLKFVDDAELSEYLFLRRPDLQDVELTCENANTELPAIDLALEALENAVALPLEVALEAGTDIEAQLRGATVGPEVSRALGKTAWRVAPDLRATPAGSDPAGTSAWTVVDGHRRWTLTARPEDGLAARAGTGPAERVELEGVELAPLVAALDDGRVSGPAELALVKLFTKSQRRSPSYDLTVEPVVPGESWRVRYRVLVELIVDCESPRVAVQSRDGEVWWETDNPKTCRATIEELADGALPRVVERMLAKLFGASPVKIVPSRDNTWLLESAERELMLSFRPAGLKITALAYQSGDTSVDAIAWPENRNPEAYRWLQSAVFPWSLPFALPLEEIRRFLERARSSRRRLLELLVPVDGEPRDDPVVVREVLGLSGAEADLIARSTAATDDSVFAHWGQRPGETRIWDASGGSYVSGSPLDRLMHVSILLQQSRLDLDELRETLETAFVSQGRPPLRCTPAGTCTPSELRLPGLTVGHLDRISRFVRLRRRLGWTTKDLDDAIPPGASLDDTLLRRLADLIRLHEVLDAPVSTIVAWWSGPVSAEAQRRGLTRGLRLSGAELGHALALLDVAFPFAGPPEMLAFCERVGRLAGAGLPFEDLRYVLQHGESPVADAVLDPAQLVRLADAVRGAAGSVADGPPPAELRARREDAVVTALANRLGVGRELVAELLRTRLHDRSNAANPKPAFDPLLTPAFVAAAGQAPEQAAAAVLVRLHKAALVCSALNLGPVELGWLRRPAPDAGAEGLAALDFDLLPVEAGALALSPVLGYDQLAAVARIRRLAGRGSELLSRYVAAGFGDTAAPRGVLAAGVGLQPEVVAKAALQLGMTTSDRHRDPVALVRLVDLLIELKRLGATFEQAASLATASPDDAASATVRELLRVKFDDSSWHDVVKPIGDSLRERQRGALVDFLVARDQLQGADDLYERYLIDVEIGSCRTTTRILQATAAVQLFVQRVLLNLEPPLRFSDDKRQLWEWMHTYRIWEANRKVFLFPENWLLPELRDDKTAIFRRLEGALTEHEPSLEATHEALLGYLEDLGDLAQVRVIAMFQDDTTLHAVGRTPNAPHRYFWRSCPAFGDSQMSWSGWEALEVDDANDYIMPFVFEGDFHVAWPRFRKTNGENDKPLWEVQLAWMGRTSRGWSKKKLGQQLLVVDRLINKTELNSFSFRLRPDTPGLTAASTLKEPLVQIDCYAASAATPDPVSVAPPTEGVKLRPTGNEVHYWVNVSLDISVRCWGKWRPPGEPNDRYERLSDVTVTVKYLFGYWGGGYDTKTTTLPASGQTVLAVRNHDKVEVTVRRGSQTRDLQSVTLVSDDNREFESWAADWTVVFDFGQKSPTGQFDPARPVLFNKVGQFSMDALHDLTATSNPPAEPLPMLLQGTKLDGHDVPATVVGNSYAFGTITDRLPVPVSSPAPLGHDAHGRLTITTASGRSLTGLDEGTAWYLQDLERRLYLQLRSNGVTMWADGQDFIGLYRRLAAPSVESMFSLFDPDSTVLQRISGKTSFERSMPSANYNWELFLHAPLAIAAHLVAQQRFSEARRWLHAVFDPTTTRTANNVPQFWRFVPFVNGVQPDSIQRMLSWLSDPAADPNKAAAVAAQVQEWKQNPFMPHLIARLRPSAYQWYAFFAYVEFLIGWGDQLYRRWTRESLNDATQLYVLAKKLLGPRPRAFSSAERPAPQTFRSLRAGKRKLDAFGNAWVEFADLPGVKDLHAMGWGGTAIATYAATATTTNGRSAAISLHDELPLENSPQVLTSLGALAFCIPQNDKLTELHDRLDERLWNLRRCMTIDGIEQDLPLFDPPIDPLLLIRAKAAGLDLDSVVAAGSLPPGAGRLPNYRFTFTLQRALDLTSELKSLGTALLSALEKQDAEELALLRSRHEIAMNKLVHETRQRQRDDADNAIAALRKSKDTVAERFAQYQRLLGKTGVTPGADGLPVVEQSSSLSVSTDAGGGASGLGLSRREVDQLLVSAIAHTSMQAANAAHVVGSVLSLVPNTWAGGVFSGSEFGGTNLANAASAIGKAIEIGTAEANYQASQLSTFGGYERRQDEWVHQSKLALAELRQIETQIVGAEIRRDIADLELRNHDQQLENAQEADEFMRTKFTNKELFRWMSSQLADVYFRSYQLALDQARRAELAYRYELGLDGKGGTFIQPGYWDSLKHGLLAGEQLYHDLKRMEVSHLEQDTREYELTKHISLALVDPLALLALKTTDECTIDVPETIFDFDYPGQYLRRIKSVSVTIPCVTGPYAGVSCTLELRSSHIRHSAGLNGGKHARQPGDNRFSDDLATVQSIATSSGQNDSGLFETSLHDERYLPFEGAGAISTWSLRLPKRLKRFDYDTISDVVLHLRYTARRGPQELEDAATGELDKALALFENDDLAARPPLALLVSLRHDFPSEWARLVAPDPQGGANRTQAFAIERSRFPGFLRGRALTVKEVDIFVSSTSGLPDDNPALTPPGKSAPAACSVIESQDLDSNPDPDRTLVRHLRTTRTDAHAPDKPNVDVVVADEADDAHWSVTASAPLRPAIRDIVLVLGYIATPDDGAPG